MKLSDFSPDIRRIKRTDVPDAMRLKDQEGWNQTRKDWIFLMEEDHLCLVADDRGAVVATTAAAVYAGETAWIGMVLVDPAYRGMGISKKLLNRLINELSGMKNIGLDATEAGKRIYEKLGFVEEYNILRMVCHAPDDDVFWENEISPRLAELSDLPQIVALDRHDFGADRTSLINHLLKNYPNHARVLEENGKITGFALGRIGSRYFQIGPVSAMSEKDAEQLIVCSFQNAGRPLVVDIPEYQTVLYNRLVSTGFTLQRSFTRMVLNKNTVGHKDHHYLIAGPEYG